MYCVSLTPSTQGTYDEYVSMSCARLLRFINPVVMGTCNYTPGQAQTPCKAKSWLSPDAGGLVLSHKHHLVLPLK